MGKSPGKWIKGIIFGKKAPKAKSPKERNLTVSSQSLSISISKGVIIVVPNIYGDVHRFTIQVILLSKKGSPCIEYYTANSSQSIVYGFRFHSLHTSIVHISYLDILFLLLYFQGHQTNITNSLNYARTGPPVI